MGASPQGGAPVLLYRRYWPEFARRSPGQVAPDASSDVN
jgi:hypothetical protein